MSRAVGFSTSLFAAVLATTLIIPESRYLSAQELPDAFGLFENDSEHEGCCVYPNSSSPENWDYSDTTGAECREAAAESRIHYEFHRDVRCEDVTAPSRQVSGATLTFVDESTTLTARADLDPRASGYWEIWTKTLYLTCRSKWDEGPCEGTARTPVVTKPPSSTELEYCNHAHTPHAGPSKGAYWRPAGADWGGASVWVRAVGGHILDQYTSWVTIKTQVRGITKGTSEAVRNAQGCKPPASGKNTCACIRAGSSQSPNIRSCLKGSGACWKFNDLTFQRCVPDSNLCGLLQRSWCSNDLGHNYEHVYIRDSGQCDQ